MGLLKLAVQVSGLNLLPTMHYFLSEYFHFFYIILYHNSL